MTLCGGGSKWRLGSKGRKSGGSKWRSSQNDGTRITERNCGFVNMVVGSRKDVLKHTIGLFAGCLNSYPSYPSARLNSR